MRRVVSLVLLLTVFSQGCASSGQAPSSATAPPDSFETINLALAGQKATIELLDGRIVRGARQVEMSPASTSWRSGSESGLSEVPTAQVVRVTLEPKRKVLRGLGYGALIGGAIFFLGGSGGDEDPSGSTDALGAEVLVGSVVVGGLIGAGVGAARRTRAQVVYSAPDAAE